MVPGLVRCAIRDSNPEPADYEPEGEDAEVIELTAHRRATRDTEGDLEEAA
ncbi:hypothetical protein [Sanguibacter sp. HDW7]|uniref:hypothetical protein n=1 Tax=Sanguibacter sp. HDW7 TaxID=2714931 RepID=UPI00140A5FE9|nr:hypothetical protein [Sanguibacter sp. HDW7]QIK83125.1 hypothetical protein G7063_05385 [Sanguibacter sp. HDW7]